jgi:hypothetical protein
MKLINMEKGGYLSIDDKDVSGIDYKIFDGKHYGVSGDDGHGGKVVTAIIKVRSGDVFEVPCLYSEYLSEKDALEAALAA